MNVVLIGYRGTGKTTVGKHLAKELGYKFIETDREIIKKAGWSIPEIVKKWGWPYFRDLETEVIREVTQLDKCVLDTGGGVILREENVQLLKKCGVIILLTASISEITRRIKHSTDRPSLTQQKSFVEEIKEVLEARAEKYRTAAEYVIDTSSVGVPEVASEIYSYLKKHYPNYF
jgi:shikimate kinase